MRGSWLDAELDLFNIVLEVKIKGSESNSEIEERIYQKMELF